MSLIWLTDGSTGNKVALNPKYVIAVFTATEGEAKGLTIISLVNGTVSVKETEIEVVTTINGG